MEVKLPFRIALQTIILLLLAKNIVLGVLLTDPSSAAPAVVHIFLLYLIHHNSRFTGLALRAWAIIYLLIFTGIKAGAKSLIILRGDGWEINTFRFAIDILLVIIGLLVVLFEEKMMKDHPEQKRRENTDGKSNN